MNDLEQMFERQAAWQRSRSNLPWAEKLRLSVVMRESLIALRQSTKDCSTTADDTPQQRRDVRAQ
ncbi:hypothetical protein ES708_21304 [subsurface metagenome]